MFTLNVGCGWRGNGDVNVDLHPEPTNHRTCDIKKAGRKISMKRTTNFVVADAAHLPFQSGVFDEVVSTSVVEHVKEPELMVREMWRVTKYKVFITCPHRLGDYKKPFHINFFTRKWFV